MEEISAQNQTAKLIGTLILLILLGGLCGVLFRSQIEFLGSWLIGQLGIWGLVIGTLITDTSPLPLTSEPIAIIGFGAKVPLWIIICTMSATSHLAGPIGYLCGHSVRNFSFVQKLLNGKLKPLSLFVHKHGIAAVAMGALLPIPYALTTWIAGAVGIGFWHTFLASTLRWVKTATYVYLLSLGWMMS